MERKKQKSSLEEYNELDATNFCPKCEIYAINVKNIIKASSKIINFFL